MTTPLEELIDRLDLLEAHIEQRHRQAAHERKTVLQHIKAMRRTATKLGGAR